MYVYTYLYIIIHKNFLQGSYGLISLMFKTLRLRILLETPLNAKC